MQGIKLHNDWHATRRHRPRRSAFTLLEVILSLTLIIMIMGGVFGYYSSTLKIRDEGGLIAADVMRARATLSKMADEVRHTAAILPGDGVGFKGRHNSITIVFLVEPETVVFEDRSVSEDLPPAQMDMRRVTYELLFDEEIKDPETNEPLCHGMWRSEQKTFDPNPKFVVEDDSVAGAAEDERDGEAVRLVEGELVAPEIKYLKFEYFDGAEWRDRWQETAEGQEEGASDSGALAGGGNDLDALLGSSGENITKPGEKSDYGYILPQAVRITIGTVPEEDREEEMELESGQDIGSKEDEDEQYEYHPDRFAIVVPIMQADPSLLSSRLYGVENDESQQMGGGQ